ncbi:hypothetical protein ABZ137_25280 [Streptomyces bobili]|uniref:hypothetical protein n=1 Tax=Streptomyces bobili TaxID=67280 RepID=UPI0033A02C90
MAEGRRFPEPERMRRLRTRATGTAMKEALERVDEIAAFRLGKVKAECRAGDPRLCRVGGARTA